MDAIEHLPGCDERHKPGQRCLDPADAAREIGSTPLFGFKHGCVLLFAVFIGLPVVLIASCYTLTETVWRAREPTVIRAVEPLGVTRVYEAKEYWGGSDDTPSDYIVIIYISDKPFSVIELEYTAAMTARGYLVDAFNVVGGIHKGTRVVHFGRADTVGDCFGMGPYPYGVLTVDDHRPPEVESLPPGKYAYMVSYWRQRHWLRWSTGC